MSFMPAMILFYIESFSVVGRKHATRLFPEYLSSLPPLTFLSDKKFRAITLMWSTLCHSSSVTLAL